MTSDHYSINLRPPAFFVGLDLGQVHDPTAIAILERTDYAVDRNPLTLAWNTRTRLSFRYLERLPLGTLYPDVVDHVRRLVRRQELQRCTLVLDATGVGQPVLDMFKRAQLPCRIVPVTITGGDRQSSESQHWRVPKRDLVASVLVPLQNGEIAICGHLREAATLVKELGGMRVKITPDGNEKYQACEGEHDDLVLAAALACWRATWRA